MNRPKRKTQLDRINTKPRRKENPGIRIVLEPSINRVLEKSQAKPFFSREKKSSPSWPFSRIDSSGTVDSPKIEWERKIELFCAAKRNIDKLDVLGYYTVRHGESRV